MHDKLILLGSDCEMWQKTIFMKISTSWSLRRWCLTISSMSVHDNVDNTQVRLWTLISTSKQCKQSKTTCKVAGKLCDRNVYRVVDKGGGAQPPKAPPPPRLRYDIFLSVCWACPASIISDQFISHSRIWKGKLQRWLHYSSNNAMKKFNTDTTQRIFKQVKCI